VRQIARRLIISVVFLSLHSAHASEVFDPIFSYRLTDEQLKPYEAKLEEILARLLAGAEKLKLQSPDPDDRLEPAYQVDFDIRYNHSRQERANVPLSYAVNAAAPGDRKRIPIDVFRGLLEFVESEDELAGIIAHETIHSRHGIDRYGKKLPLASNWLRRRRNEFEADIVGARIARAAGYDPRHVQRAMGRVLAMDNKEEALDTVKKLGMEIFRAGGQTHSLASMQERYNAMNGFIMTENRIAKLDRAADNHYDGWLERYKGALTAPWSRDEPNKGMETFLERLLHKTNLKDKPLHEQIAFIKHILFENPRYQGLFFHALMVDPHVNPNPIFDILKYDERTQSFKADEKSPILQKVNSQPPLPRSAPTHEYRTDADREFLLTYLNKITGDPSKLDDKAGIAAAKLVHSIGASSGTPKSWLSTYENPRHRAQRRWVFPPERMLPLENAFAPPPPINSMDDFDKHTWRMTPEQDLEALLRLTQKRVGSAAFSDRMKFKGDPELQRIFRALHEVPVRFWPQKNAKEYLRYLPHLHASTFGTPAERAIDKMPGYNASIAIEGRPYRSRLSSSGHLFRGVDKYLQRLVVDTEIPLALRMVVAHKFLPKKKALSYLPSIRSTNEFISAYLETGAWNISVMEDQAAYRLVKAHPQWRTEPEAIDKLFSKLDYHWMKKGAADNQKTIVAHVLGEEFALPVGSPPSAGAIKEKLGKLGYQDPDFEKSLDEIDTFTRNSSVEFDAKRSELSQRDFWKRLQRDNPNLTPLQRANFHYAMSAIGNTPFADAFAEKLYVDEKFFCQSCIERLLDKGRVWDFSTRKKIFDLWFEKVGDPAYAALPDNKARIQALTLQVHKWFPEPSGERQAIVENFSQHIESNFKEAKALEIVKYPFDENLESLTVRIFSAVRREMTSDPRFPRRPMEFVNFLIGAGDFPKMPNLTFSHRDRDNDKIYVRDAETNKVLKTKGFTHDVIGPDRIKKLFSSLSPSLQAGVLSFYLSPPRGMLANPKFVEEIKQRILLNMDRKYFNDAKLLIDALFHAEAKVNPAKFPFTVGYLLAQTGSGKSKRIGEVLREALVAQGAAGISFGQKLYQRRMLPEHMLADIADLQDNADPFTRLESFENLIKSLDLKDPDAEIKLAKVLGSASAKVVLQVKVLDGEAAAWEAIKLLRPTFRRDLEIDEEMLREFVDYVDKHGRGKFSGLGPLIADTFESLHKQSDMSTEGRVRNIMQDIYLKNLQNGEAMPVDRHGFEWHIAEPRGAGRDHLREELVKGRTVKALSESERARYAPSLYEKEESILLNKLDSKDPHERIYFERDRHFGNYIVEGNRIGVIDYPLVTSISVAERQAVFELLGNAEVSRSFGSHLPDVFAKDLVKILGIASEGAKPELLEKSIKDWLKSRDVRKEVGPQVFDLFSAMQRNGIKVKESVHAYLTALGHLEGAAHYLPKDARGNSRLQTIITSIVKRELQPKLDNLKGMDWCLLVASRLLRR
jgi:predicted unusual protein kinase regulating ubiquinone biosynthesis (AarF/ABC1/UbiB family)